MTTPIQPTPAPGELPDAQPVQRKKPSGDFAELLARKLEGGVRFSGSVTTPKDPLSSNMKSKG